MRQAIAGLILIACLMAMAWLSVSGSAIALVAASGGAMLLALWPRPEPIAAPAPPIPEPAQPDAEWPALMEAFGDPVLITGEGLIVEANAAARKLLGQHIVGEDVRVAGATVGALPDGLIRHRVDAVVSGNGC